MSQGQQDVSKGTFIVGNPGRASARMGVQLPDSNRSLGQAAEFLDQTLKSAGYNEQAWFLYEPDGIKVLGFAVFTRLEQIETSGKSLAEGKRYSLEVQSPDIHSIGDYVRVLLSPAPSGHYRTIAIYVYRRNAQPARQSVDSAHFWPMFFSLPKIASPPLSRSQRANLGVKLR
jgi:hypothetical protein